MARRLILLFFCAFSLAAFGQTPYNQVFQPDKEKRNLRSNVIARDSLGYLWLGTTEGLYRYDGFDFRHVPTDGKGDAAVTALITSPDGTTWCGFKDGRVGSVRNDTIRIVRTAGKESSPARINALLSDKKGRLWIATNGQGIFLRDGDKINRFGVQEGLGDEVVYTLVEGNTGIVYAGTDQGIYCCTLDAGKKSAVSFRGNARIPDSIVRSLLLHDGFLYIGTQDLGLFIYDLANQKMEAAVGQSQFGSWNILAAHDGKLYAGTDKGLVKTTLAPGGAVHGNATGINSRISSLAFDGENNLWVTAGETFYRSSDEKFQLLSGAAGETFSFVHSILADKKGRLWFSPDQGLRCLEFDAGGNIRMKSYTITPPRDLIDIVTLCEDATGTIWIGTVGGGLFRLHPATGRVEKIAPLPALQKANILSIASSGNTVWVAGFEGVFRFHLDDKGAYTVEAFGENTVLKNSYIYHVFPDSKGRTWFALDGLGLAVYDGKSIKTYGPKEGIASNVVYSVTEDKHGNIWFSTLDAGIYRYDGKQFTSYAMNQGLSDLTYASVASDAYGNIVAVANQGIDVIRTGTGEVLNFGPEYGLADLHPDANAVSTSPDGMLWLGTEKGILRFSPAAFVERPLSSMLSRARLFLLPVDTLRHEYSSDENHLTFDFMALHFSNPGKVNYRYLLDGHSTGWTVTKERSVTFPKLPPGQYTFRVQASLNKDFGKMSQASYSFIVNPALWQRTGFRLAVLAIIAAVLVWYIRQREQQLRRVERLQQEKIQSQFQLLKNQVNPHFLFNSFNTLVTFIEENPKVAVEYVEHLAALFRNIVTYREKDLIPLQEEFDILRNYYYIQKKRYGDHFTLTIHSNPRDQQRYTIPPLTLQILLENAIKHNAISKETPLHITVKCQGEFLHMENNRNPKRMQEPSSGLGLENVRSRYSLLTSQPVEIESDAVFFRVKLPLLSS